jgi:hypothetical protein
MPDTMTIAERVVRMLGAGAELPGIVLGAGDPALDISTWEDPYQLFPDKDAGWRPAQISALTGALTEWLVERGWGIYSGEDFVCVYKRPGEKVGFEAPTLLEALLLAAEQIEEYTKIAMRGDE